MTEQPLFDLAEPGAAAGWRLERVELLNWGTFDQAVWAFDLGERNGLLTGDIGSGKSTVVDAVSTLLLPANRIAYNRAAGADSKERTLRTYVQGLYKLESDPDTGVTRPVGLRTDRDAQSVLLAVFANSGTGAVVTLLQVFWLRRANTGLPERFFGTAKTRLSIAQDIIGPPDVPSMKRAIRSAGVVVRDAFKDYAADYRRLLGIPSAQAMDLFHQTISMKSVGDLNDFVRRHMLEAFDARAAIDKLIDHVEDLTAAHDAVLRARAQLEALEPVVRAADQHDAAASAVQAASARLAALPVVIATAQQSAATAWSSRTAERLAEATAQREQHVRRAETARALIAELHAQRDQAGGDRMRTIARLLVELPRERDRRREASDRFQQVLGAANLPPVQSDAELAERHRRLDRLWAQTGAEASAAGESLTAVAVAFRDLTAESDDLRAELKSLQGRASNIPVKQVMVRDQLCADLGVEPDQIPFAGELLRVSPGYARWEGVAERALGAFGLSLVVPDARYRDVARWLNQRNVGTKIAYHRVAAAVPARRPEVVGGPLLRDALEIADSPYADWIDAELDRRADHLLAESIEEFAHARKAVTAQGQIKHSPTYHEKNDARPIGDRKNYVLGWDNRAKTDLLLERAATVQAGLGELERDRQRFADRQAKAQELLQQLARRQDYLDWDRIDWRSVVREIDALAGEKRELEQGSADLKRLAAAIEAAQDEAQDHTRREGELNREIGRLESDAHTAANRAARAAHVLAEPLESDAKQAFDPLASALREEIDRVLAGQGDVWDDLSGLERSERVKAEAQRENAARRRNTHLGQAVVAMKNFRTAHPQLATDLTEEIASAPEYRELHDRLENDDLPRFEDEFKRALNTETIREVAYLHARLDEHQRQIRDRVRRINESLATIEYNPGRYIRLVERTTAEPRVREFRADLRACMDESLEGGDEQYSERKFSQVKAIVDRFRGRDGRTLEDREWTEHVTDVRNWFVFSASERHFADDSEYEHYTGSGGKSGGQKEKLAFTVLAASLAYQFRIEPDERPSQSFRFVVIDEAFSRGSDESTRFALGLFGRLGLQLLVVTPLTKIPVIEPFVSAVVFVENRTGATSQLQTLTITEFRHRRDAALAAERTDARPEAV